MANFEALPHGVQLRVFARVPIDSRLRCAEVCRAWRQCLQDEAAWAHIVIPDCSDAAYKPNTLLEAALMRAGRQLETLDLSAKNDLSASDTSSIAITDLGQLVVRAGAGTQLRELRLGPRDFVDTRRALEFIAAAPQLRLLCVAVRWSEWYNDAEGRLELDDPRFHAVRICTLGLDCKLGELTRAEQAAFLARVQTEVAKLTHPEFKALYLDSDELSEEALLLFAELSAGHAPPLVMLGLQHFFDAADRIF